jgi:hypothetical protein
MKTPGITEQSPVVPLNFGLDKDSFRHPTVKVKPFGFLAKTFLFYLRSSVVKNFLPETLTLPLPLAQSVSKPKLSHSVKFYQNHFHKEKTGKKESLCDHASEGKKQGSR